MRGRLLLLDLLLLSLLFGQVITIPILALAGFRLSGLQADELSGRQIDVFTQSGGEGLRRPTDSSVLKPMCISMQT